MRTCGQSETLAGWTCTGAVGKRAFQTVPFSLQKLVGMSMRFMLHVSAALQPRLNAGGCPQAARSHDGTMVRVAN